MKQDPVTSGRPTIKYVDIGAIDDGRITTLDSISAESAPTRARQVVRAGDTLFSTVRPYLRKVAQVSHDLDGEFASTGFCVLRPGAQVDSRYLFHFLNSELALDQILPLQRGVSYPAVRDRDVLAAKLNLPELGEQRRIVDILEDHLSRLDAAGAYARNARSRLHALETSFAAEAVRKARESGPMSTIGAHAQLVQYGTSAKSHGLLSPHDVPVLRMGNIQAGKVDRTDLKYLSSDHPDARQLLLRSGDLLFNRTNSADLVGKSAVFDDPTPTTFASYLIRVHFDDQVLPEWAAMVINSPFGRSHIAQVVSQQVGQANVNGTKLRAFPLPLPERALQSRLVSEFVGLRSSVSRTFSDLLSAEARAVSLRRALLSAAFSGELTGRASDRIEELADASNNPR